MYDPFFSMVIERHHHIREEVQVNRSLAGVKSYNRRIWQRVIYNFGGMLISLGMRLRDIALEPGTSPVQIVSEQMLGNPNNT